jgi:hypothetical protein
LDIAIRHVLYLIVSMVLITLTALQSWSEPMMIVAIGPRVESTNELSLRQDQPKGITLLRVGPRVGLSGWAPIGQGQKEEFHQYDIAATFGLPWGRQHRNSGIKLDLRLLTSAGQIAAAQDTGLMITLVPCLALSSAGEAVSIDVGTGPAFFSNYKFGAQDFGGPVQILGTAGAGLNLIPGFFTGYRLQHFSDAGVYGPKKAGVNMHLLEINYRF